MTPKQKLKQLLPKKYLWWHGVIWFAVINFLTFAWAFTDVKYYVSLNKPWFAPPPWIFGVIWPINNILIIIGNIWALNWTVNQGLENKLSKNKTQTQDLVNHEKSEEVKMKLDFRRILFILQGFSWFNYVIFSALSFGTKIPAMFFWPTFSMFLLTVASIYYAYRLEKRIAWTFLTLIIWLTLASFLGAYVWLYN